MERGLVSVIMPTYNASKYLAESIDSILSQTYTNLELLIIEDCSSDPKTIEIIKKYAAADSRVKPFFFKENKGPGCSRNNSIEHAQGQYIAFCDSDDRWKPYKLEKQIAFMTEKDCCLAYSSYIECDENNKEVGVVVAPEHITLSDLKRDNKIGCLTAIYDVTKYGKFSMSPIRKRQDWILFLTIMKQCKDAYALTEPLAYYRILQNSVSRNKIGLLKYNARVYQEVFGYTKFQSYCYLYCIFMPTYTFKVLKNKLHFLKRSVTRK